MKRLFVGVPLSEELRVKLAVLLLELQQSGAVLNLVRAEQLHFTLKFLGDVEEQQISEVMTVLRAVAALFQPFSVSLQNIGAFPSTEYMRVIWVGVENGLLIDVMKKLDERLRFIRPNEHDEKPHVTLARVKSANNKEQLQEFVRKYQHTSFGEMPVQELVLFESALMPQGAEYSVVERFQLRAVT